VSDLMVLTAVGIACFLGMFSLFSDISTNTSYNLTTPTGTQETVTQLQEDLNTTNTNIQKSFTQEEGWEQTAFNIFFTLPRTVISSISTMINIAYKLASTSAGSDSEIPMPSWILPFIYIIIAIIIVTTIVYLAVGRPI